MTEKTIVLPPNPSPNGGDAHYRLTMMVSKRRYLSYLRERWWVVLVCIALATGAIVAYETIRADTYTSFAQLYTSGQVQLNVASIFDEESQTYFGTQIELFKSARLQGAAFDRIGFVLKPRQKSPVKLEVVQPMKTSILVLQATGSDPSLTQRFLQALIDEYLAYRKETRISSSEDVVLSLNDQLAKKEKELQIEQDKLVEFQKTNNIAVLEEEGKSAGLYLADLNLQLAKFKLDRDLLAKGLIPGTNEALVMQTAVLTGMTNIASGTSSDALSTSRENEVTGLASSSSNDTALKSARVELAVRRADRDQTLTERGAVAARRLDDEVKRLERTVAILEEQNLAEKRGNLDELNKRIDAIQVSIPSWESRVLDINERVSESQRLKNNVQREQGYYDHLLATLQNVDLGKNVQQERLSVLQPATTAIPVERYLPLRIALAVFLGLFLSLGVVFCWYLFDDRFVSVRDIKDQFGEVVLGLVPQIKIGRSKPDEALLQTNDRRQAYAESYRHLRSALLLSSLGETRPQTLLFTGAAPAEGKTTIAVNLARVLARSGLRVALVDADSHGGGIQRLLHVEGQAGVLDYLRGEAEVKAIQHPTDLPGLTLVPAGTHTEHGKGLFLRPRLKDMMKELRTDHDFVILDGAPILTSDNAALLVPHADAVVLVVCPFFSRSKMVRRALDMLYQRQAKRVAIILNRARAEDMAGHYAQNGATKTSRRSGTSLKAPVTPQAG